MVKKVPVIMQLEQRESGSVSLAMILAHHKKWVPPEKVREDCAVGRDGSNAEFIKMAAENYGLEVALLSGGIADLRSAFLPCMLCLNPNHFVVLCGLGKKYAYINDPAVGKVKIPIARLEKIFTGIYLVFRPNENFVPEGRPQGIFKFAAKCLKGTAVPFLFVILTGLLTSVLGIINPVLRQVFLDRVLTGQNPEWLAPVIMGMAGVAAASVTVLIINESYLLKIRGKLAVVANAAFMWHIMRLPMSFFHQRMAGDISGRLNFTETIAETLISKLAPLALNLILTVVYISVMLRYSVLLTVIGLGAAVINGAAAWFISMKRANNTRIQARDEARLAGITMGGVQMIETIKASGSENGFFALWAGIKAAVNNSKVEFAKANAFLGAVPELVSSLTSIAILILGAYLILGGFFTAGMLLAFQGFYMGFASPANSFIEAAQCLQEARVLMERIDDVFNCEPDVTEKPQGDIGKLSGSIELKGVTFGYSKLAEPLIKDFSMSLNAGSSVAFVGASGCGKSTLAKLISGLYKPWSGEILFDGQKIEDIDRNTFTCSVSVVDQDITIFEDSISDNVKLWDNSIEDYEVILSCKDAGLHQDILQRGDGYNYALSENGKNFSGGQRQRLEIARALAVNPSVLIMDEATSALDAVTEHKVVTAVKDRGLTCVVIAHRLSTVKDCDEIIVMDKGKAVQRGSHEELINQDGLYRRLFETE